jgi:tetratricopeptide (TPR) repeat protein
VIAEAEQAGIYIIAVGVGTEDGGYVPNPDSTTGQMIDPSGRPVISRLQTNVMRKLAEETRGRFTVAGSGQDIPALVKSVVQGLDSFQMEGRERRISIEFYQWLMFPAILFLIVSITSGTRWKRIQAVTLTTAGFFLIGDARASDASNAKEALTGQKYEEARDAYHKLAEKTKSTETQARYRLGEATAAYRAEDFRNARTAYSQSLLSSDPQVQASGHLGMGNSLFQLGWKGLSGESYPTDPESVPDLDRFDTIVKEALAKLSEADTPEEGDASDYAKIESLITNWADAVRHYDSAAMRSPSDQTSNKNRNLTITYLKRLEELLDQEKQDAEQAMAEAGQGPPQEGEGDGEGEPKEGEKGEKSPKKPGEKGEGDEKPKDGSGDEGDKDKDGKKGKDKDKKDGDKNGENPNESPQDRAKRILKENADLEKGPLSPGRREFRDADKDW